MEITLNEQGNVIRNRTFQIIGKMNYLINHDRKLAKLLEREDDTGILIYFLYKIEQQR
jgi:hypothetical protein